MSRTFQKEIYSFNTMESLGFLEFYGGGVAKKR
jgi:hypothetical protein